METSIMKKITHIKLNLYTGTTKALKVYAHFSI